LDNIVAHAAAAQTLHVHSPDGSTFLHEMMSRPPSWQCDVRSKTRLRKSMGTYLLEEQSCQIASRGRMHNTVV